MSKENTIKAEGIVDNFLDSKFMKNVKIGYETFRQLVIIYVPLTLAIYLLHTQDDKLVLAIGVAAGIVSFVNTFTAVFTAVKSKKKPRRRK